MKVRIVNNGQPGHMTKITNVETGEPVLDLHLTQVFIEVMSPMPAAILVSGTSVAAVSISPEFDIVANADINSVGYEHTCPCCGKPVDATEGII